MLTLAAISKSDHNWDLHCELSTYGDSILRIHKTCDLISVTSNAIGKEYKMQ